MSISRRALYEAGLPFGDSATYRKSTGGRVYGDGGGSSAPTTQTTVTDIPNWAKPYGKEILGKAQALANQPYQPYTGGERFAGFTPLQQQAQEAAGTMTTAPQLQAATGLAGAGALQSLGAGQQYQQMATTPGAMQAYMSPYMQGVVDIQQREAQRQADIARTGRGAQAVKSGAFGGARQAIMEAEAGRNLQQQLGDIQARGLQSAFDRAQQAQQFGATLGLQGAQQAGQLAQTLGGLGATEFGQQKDIIGLQSAAGKEQQALEQSRLEQQYQDFLRQQQYPYQQLGFMSDMLRGVPVGQTSQTIFQQPPASTIGQLAGLGTGLYGLSQMGFKPFAEGGPVAKYADQGSVTSATNIADIVDSLSDEQLQAAYQSSVARQDVKTAQIIQEEMADRAMTREGRGLAAAADIPEDMFSARAAKGGILKFAEGSDPYGMRPEDYRLMEERARQAEAEAQAINQPQAQSVQPPQAAVAGVPFSTREGAIPALYKLLTEDKAPQTTPDKSLEQLREIQKAEDAVAAKAREAQEASFKTDRQETLDRINALEKRGLGAALAAFGFGMARAASKPGAKFFGSMSEGTKDLQEAVSSNQKSIEKVRDIDRALAKEQRQLRIAMDAGDAKRTLEHQREIIKLQKQQQEAADNSRRTDALIQTGKIQGISALMGALPKQPDPTSIQNIANDLQQQARSEGRELSRTEALSQAAALLAQSTPSYLGQGTLNDLRRQQIIAQIRKRFPILDQRGAQEISPVEYQEALRQYQEALRAIGFTPDEISSGQSPTVGGSSTGPRVVGVRPSAG